jgi:hypothetical protein
MLKLSLSVVIARLDGLYLNTRSRLSVAPAEPPAIGNKKLLADALLRLSSALPDDNEAGFVKNQQLARIGFGTLSYCLILAICKVLGARWNNSESAVRQRITRR